MASASSLSLVGGVLALDFANTASGRGSTTPHDHIRAPSDLLDWTRHAGIVDGATRRRLGDAFAADPRLAGRTLDHALTLREAIYRIGTAIAQRETPAGSDLDTLRRAAQGAIASGELKPLPQGGYGFDFHGGTPEAALTGPWPSPRSTSSRRPTSHG